MLHQVGVSFDLGTVYFYFWFVTPCALFAVCGSALYIVWKFLARRCGRISAMGWQFRTFTTDKCIRNEYQEHFLDVKAAGA